MKILPSSGSRWLAMLLIPFKVFVPVGYLMVVIQRETLGYRMDTGAITSFSMPEQGVGRELTCYAPNLRLLGF
jgi:hypothetical protein